MKARSHRAMRGCLGAALRCGLILVVGACANASDTASQPVPERTEVQTKAAERETVDEVDGVDSETTITPTRWARRIKIDQLQASLPRVAGNDENGVPITWRVGGQDALDDQRFGVVLGRPDYVTRTAENPASSSLYLKFMRDMARDVCTQIVDADTKRMEGEPKTLWRYAPVQAEPTEAQMTENLQYLALRFLGMRLDPAHPTLKDLRSVYGAGVASTDLAPSSPKARAEGWRGVCIGLLESPLFHID